MTLAARRGFALAGLLVGLAATGVAADPPTVVYKDGLLSIQCADAPLTAVLEKVKAATGMELIWEGSAGNTRLTAQIAAQPVSLALPRLLEGTGINYLLLADRADPRRVATLYVGEATAAAPGTTAARTSPRLPRPAPPRDEPEPMPELQAAELPELEDDEPPPPSPAETAPEAAPPVVAPGAPPAAQPGFHPVVDPFGRAIPVRSQAERATRGRPGDATPPQNK
jgi:hypothetical protein